jgi:hypothetical protein
MCNLMVDHSVKTTAGKSMFRTSIRRKIVGIAMGLVILMVARPSCPW